ncbi:MULTISPECIES: helix-turn-helix domain-containing protein [Streptomyces]|uniref:helix-turn-helix domain-containing protein n=1 Tax=Streptomyces TaxID=1883 RepID=UPI001B3820FC|nr:helix-turn-helix transcriptional regulator [Streptomyces sp. RK75]MBQ0863385.1 helix-turn-helix transcriptional regulator [Streptomyces sp. RK75]
MAANPLGPVGLTVQRNVKRLREEQNLGLAALSRRLDGIGRKIPTLGLSRIESGERRVDADDLVALAAALDVSPVTLMLPAEDPGEPVQLAERLTVGEWRAAWLWMHGEAPVVTRVDSGSSRAKQVAWEFRNRPYLSEGEMAPFTHPPTYSDEFLEEFFEGPEGEDDGSGG